LTELWAAGEPTTTGHYPVNTAERLRERIRRFFWMAERQGGPVGFVCGSLADGGRDAWLYQVAQPSEACLELGQLYVHPNPRGQGIGGELVERLLAEARAAGIERHVVASAGCDWEPIRRFYERHGFRPWHFRMFTGESTEERRE